MPSRPEILHSEPFGQNPVAECEVAGYSRKRKPCAGDDSRGRAGSHQDSLENTHREARCRRRVSRKLVLPWLRRLDSIIRNSSSSSDTIQLLLHSVLAPFHHPIPPPPKGRLQKHAPLTSSSLCPARWRGRACLISVLLPSTKMHEGSRPTLVRARLQVDHNLAPVPTAPPPSGRKPRKPVQPDAPVRRTTKLLNFCESCPASEQRPSVCALKLRFTEARRSRTQR